MLGLEERIEEEKGSTRGENGRYNGIVVPSVLYGSETWEMNAGLRQVFDMRCMIPVRVATARDSIRFEDIRKGCVLKYKLCERVNLSVLR